MIVSYKVIEDSPYQTVYEYNTLLTWVLYIASAIGVGGHYFKILPLQIFGGVVIALYFYFAIFQAVAITRDIRAAKRAGKIRQEGDKHSFTKPLRYYLTKDDNKT